MYTASWRDVIRPDLFGTTPVRRDRPYRGIIRLCLVVFRLFRFHFDVRGAEHVPATGGAIICSNHVSFFDFTFLGLGALPQHRLVRFMAKSAVFDHWFSGRFMRAMQHIPVDRKAGTAAFDLAVRALKDGEVVGVFPEATISTASPSRTSRPAPRGWPSRPACRSSRPPCGAGTASPPRATRSSCAATSRSP